MKVCPLGFLGLNNQRSINQLVSSRCCGLLRLTVSLCPVESTGAKWWTCRAQCGPPRLASWQKETEDREEHVARGFTRAHMVCECIIMAEIERLKQT